MREFLIRLPWPDRALWQNTRQHWARSAKAIKAARTEALALAKNACVEPMPGAILEFSFHPPDRRRRDIQNMPATLKAAIDGIADAMGIDDSTFRPRWPDTFGAPVSGGCVLVHIKAGEGEA